MDERHSNHRFVWAAGMTLLVAVCGQPVAADAGEADLVELRTDLDIVRRRILEPLLAPVSAETARDLLGSLRPDGSWPGIDYQDRSRSGWRTVRHLSNVATLARAYRSPQSKLRGDETMRRGAESVRPARLQVEMVVAWTTGFGRYILQHERSGSC